jgi:hypothetical protein
VARTGAILAGLALLVGGCSTPAEPARSGAAAPDRVDSVAAWPTVSGVLTEQVPPTWWPVSRPRGLAATGIEVVAANLEPDLDPLDEAQPDLELVVDGAGAAWLLQPWRLTRIDLASGAARTWDIGNDLAFGQVSTIRPSRARGVWLVGPDHLWLFDGERFVRDVVVPARFLGGPGGSVRDMVEVGSQVWVAGGAGVARCGPGGWNLVGATQLHSAHLLAVDGQGVVWALGELSTEEGIRSHVVRLEGSRWVAPGGAQGPTVAQFLAGDPAGGVVTAFGHRVRRFSGTWRDVGWTSAFRTADALVVGEDGVLWMLAGMGASVVRCAAGGSCVTIPRHGSGRVGAVSVVGHDLLIADARAVTRVRGDQLETVHRLAGAGGRAFEEVSGFVAVSADEVWAGVVSEESESLVRLAPSSADEPAPAMRPSGQDGDWGYDGGPRVGGDADWSGATPIRPFAVASDRALWTVTDPAVLLRFDGGASQVVPWAPEGAYRGVRGLVAGPDGAVWAMPGQIGLPAPGAEGWTEADWARWERQMSQVFAQLTVWLHTLTLVRPDGQTTTVRLPEDVEGDLSALVVGLDGTMWIEVDRWVCVEDDWSCTPATETLMRWDGQWSNVPFPGVAVRGVSVAADGSLWAELATSGAAASPEHPVLARYTAGTWRTYPALPALVSVTAAPGRSPCGIDAASPAVVCIGTDDQVTNTPIVAADQLLMGVDGSLWLGRENAVARLPVTAPE